VRRTAESQPVGILRIIWRLSRPPVWMVSILPVFMGHMLASRELLPGLERWGALTARATSEGVSAGQVWSTFTAWIGDARTFLLALLVMGPLVWGATLAINDAYDVAGDRLNPRKAHAPVVRGLITPAVARRIAYFFAVAALAVAASIGLFFMLLVGAFLALAWAYSVPPLRLKTRPGADLAVNALGIGVIAVLAGWSAVRPLSEFPWIVLVQGVLVATAVYVPTTLVDEAADRASGFLTLATAYGRERAYRIGWRAWSASCAGAVVLAATNTVVPRRMLPIFALSLPVLLWEYHALIGKARDERAIARGTIICSLTFAASNFIFALMYTGVWR
jgi:4-hydroxybenzoate polyprenyltransferase